MLTKLCAAALLGIDALKVEIETNVSGGLPAFTVVGLPDSAIKESRERILTAIRNSGFELPSKKITVNLAPADVKKEGTSFDLGIAVGLLGSLGEIKGQFEDIIVLGELALDGSVRRISGTLPMAVMAARENIRWMIVPKMNAAEAAVAISATGAATQVFGVETLIEAAGLLNGSVAAEPVSVNVAELFDCEPEYPVDFAEIKGQLAAKKAIEIAAAGGHNLLTL